MAKHEDALVDTARESNPAAIADGDSLLAIGDATFLSHRLTSEEVTIGRDPDCDFVVAHHAMSRRHALLRLHGEPTIQDLGSTNGTRVTGRVLRGGEPATLDDSGFRIGPFAFILLRRRPGAERSIAGADLLRIDDPTRGGAPAIVRDFALSGANMLITGETGVGKEVLAATVHALSERTGGFVQINCAALTETLLESELFGHERGAFTGATTQKRGLIEAAQGGTILLDEIGELPLATQAKLLRVIEHRELLRLGATQPTAIDVRFIAATNRDLRAEVARGAFRADLFYRVDGVTLWIPPLRERRGAIVPLAIDFLAAARSGRDTQLTADVVAALEDYAWPGNVRELKAVIARACVLAGAGALSVRHLTFAKPVAAAASSAPIQEEDRIERERIVKALAECAGNQSRAAKQLGISRTTLITKLRIYKIPRPTRP